MKTKPVKEIKLKDIKKLADIPSAGTEFLREPHVLMVWRYAQVRVPVLPKHRHSKLFCLRPGEIMKFRGVLYFRDLTEGRTWRLWAERVLRTGQVNTEFRKPFPSSHEEQVRIMREKAIEANQTALTPSENPTNALLYPIVKDVLDFPVKERPKPADALADMSEAWEDEPVEDLDVWPRIKQFFRNMWAIFKPDHEPTNKETE